MRNKRILPSFYGITRLPGFSAAVTIGAKQVKHPPEGGG